MSRQVAVGDMWVDRLCCAWREVSHGSAQCEDVAERWYALKERKDWQGRCARHGIDLWARVVPDLMELTWDDVLVMEVLES